MKVVVVCPRGHQFRCAAEHLGRSVRCPHEGCSLKFTLRTAEEIQPKSPACPSCGHALAPGAVLCTACGFDLVGGDRVETIVDAPKAPPTAPVLEGPEFKVYDELDRLHRGSAGWGRGLVVLALSIVAFVLLGVLHFELADIVLLAVVVLVHELGHLAAMRLFGYRNLRLFLIPLFGGAAAGHKTSAPGWQRSLVALAGPVPGLIIGYVLLVTHCLIDQPSVGTAGILFIALNALNLLPFFPLDGGRLMNDVLFCRERHLETAFRAGTALLLLGLGVLARDFIIGGFGGLMLVGTFTSTRLAELAADLRDELGPLATGDDDRIPGAAADRLIAAVRERLKLRHARSIAIAVDDVWERITARPPGPVASVGLLLLYGASVASAVLVPVVVILLVAGGALPCPTSGPIAAIAVISQGGPQQPYSIRDAACDCDDVALRQFLVAGISPDEPDIHGAAPLHYAAGAECFTTARALLQAGADLESTTNQGVTPLTQAVLEGKVEFLEFLIDRGAAVDARARGGMTPLMYAASHGWPVCVEALLRAGADPRARDEAGTTVLGHARYADDEAARRVITERLQKAIDA